MNWWRMKIWNEERRDLRLLPRPSFDYLSSVILQNNTTADIHVVTEDYYRKIVVVCENKPRDMPIFGISFEPEKSDT